jgi:16S rRNA U516 pseudouridylate synthase RsuA-like enzyme
MSTRNTWCASAYGALVENVQAAFPAAQLARLRHGLALDGQPLKPAQVDWQNPEQLRFVLREGKKRQIRRMCELVGLTVTGLKRIRIGRVPWASCRPGSGATWASTSGSEPAARPGRRRLENSRASSPRVAREAPARRVLLFPT